ncbi:Uncharacterised protein [Bordetella pertussis]|nr:Uncharacterised protein [Bordetella pertussis]CPM14488.1 Uncharacterised protein [Bordetella pertussis]
MAPGRQRGGAAARRALQVAVLDQIRLDDVFDGVALFADRRRQAVHADRAAVELVHDGFEQLAVHDIQALRVHIQHGQRAAGGVLVDHAVRLDLRIVAHAPQQAVGDTRRAARAARHFVRAVGGDVGVEQAGAARDDAGQFVGVVELQPRHDAEAVAQRIGQHAGAGGGAHQREGLQVQLDAARGRAFADQDVDLEVFQRRIEDFLDHRRQAVDLVDEQDVVAFQVGQQRRQVARALQHGAGRLAQLHAHFVRDDVRQGGLAQARRAEQQDMVERLAALARGRDEDLQLFARALLADVFFQRLGPQGAFDRLLVGRHRLRRDNAGRIGQGRERVGLNGHKFGSGRARKASYTTRAGLAPAGRRR